MTEMPTLSPAAPKPDHVADAFVYDFDSYNDPGLLRDPGERAAEIIKEAPPIFWTPRNGGHWIVVGHDAVFKAARAWDIFSSQLVPQSEIDAMYASLPPEAPRVPQGLPACADPPAHAKYRTPLNGAFSPKTVLALKEEIRDLAVDLIEAVGPKGRCELMSEIAEPLPVNVFLKMFGLPVERREEYRAIVKLLLASPYVAGPERARRSRLISDAIHESLISRRDNPRGDIISLIWQFEIDGEPMSLHVMESYSISLFLAGLDTVMNAMGHGVRHLALNPSLQEELRADSARVPDVAEEILRLHAFAVPLRVVVKDAEFEGAQVRKGERALFFLPAANRDPSKYANPDAFDLERDNKVHIAFGAGPHRCLGSHLARLELQVFYEELVRRLPTFRLDPKEPVRYHGGTVIGPDALHIMWDL